MSQEAPTLIGEYLFPTRDTRTAYVRCPTCGHQGWIDQDQWRGETSIDCPACPYHRTVDMRDHVSLE